MSVTGLLTGQASVTVDGTKLRTENGATLNIGGITRKSVDDGTQVLGFKNNGFTAPTMKCTIAHGSDTSLRQLSDMTGATVMFETDSGARYVMRDAFTTEAVELNGKDGTVQLTMESTSCDEM